MDTIQKPNEINKNDKNYSILLISNMNTHPTKSGIQSKKEDLYDTLKKSNLFTKIKIVSLEAIKHINELLLSVYDCVIYDLCDSACDIENPTEEIRNYIKNGGNVIVTHDFPPHGLLDIIGIKEKKYSFNQYHQVKIINYEHEIWKSYYDLNDWKSRPINIALTHAHYLQANNETKRLMVSYDDNDELYLTTRKIGMGNAIFWNAGHSPNITPEEKKLFINIIIWALKNN